MTNTYTWNIDKLFTRSETLQDGTVRDDAVVEIHWRRTATSEDGYTANYKGVNFITSVLTDSSNYVPFDSLTIDHILNWIKATNLDDMINITKILDANIVQQRNPKVERSLPWL